MRERLLALLQGSNRWLVIAFGVLLLLGGASFLLLRQENYALLYDTLSPEDSQAITLLLERKQIPYRIENDGQKLVVPSALVGSTRIAVAEEGLPRAASLGYEIFDREQGLSTSNFVQEINLLRALEGELARTITSIQGITNTRVHIVLPKRELFSRDRQIASASIILTTRNDSPLGRRKIRAIQNLVAAAVPKLNADQVAITDARGNLLARSGADSVQNFLGSTPDEIRTAYETRLAQQLQSLVGSAVGLTNVRVEVNVEMDFGQTVVNEEIYDPDGQVLRSSEEVEEQTRRLEASEQPVSVETNLPETQLRNIEGQGVVEESSRSEVRRNYDITKRLVNRVVAPGQIDKISVAILVDGTYDTQDEEGTPVYTPRAEEELLQIGRLVKSAIGFDESGRQDVVEVVNLQFFEEEGLVDQADRRIFGIPEGQFGNIIEKTILAAVFIIALLAVIGPFLLRLLSMQREEQQARLAQLGQRQTMQSRREAMGLPPLEQDLSEALNIEDIEDKLKSSVTTQLNEVITRYPEETLSVLRGWLGN